MYSCDAFLDSGVMSVLGVENQRVNTFGRILADPTHPFFASIITNTQNDIRYNTHIVSKYKSYKILVNTFYRFEQFNHIRLWTFQGSYAKSKNEIITNF